ncbi:MAG: tetratricopeptide repeat protein [Acidobacteria bacterium]|nr:tetratricopeptide repeat protein [Acidobacteriota bacterium]
MTWFPVTLAVGAVVLQPSGIDVQRAFEAGMHEQVVEAVQGSDAPRDAYLAGLSLIALERIDEARVMFGRLAERPAVDPWHSIGVSALRLHQSASGESDPAATTQAEEAARAAVRLDDTLSLAYYQLGLVQGRKRAYDEAAVAFEAAMALEPTFAYAYYYAGLSFYQIDRTDKMAEAFETFLKLAPDAPERERVESVLRTLRGRR